MSMWSVCFIRHAFFPQLIHSRVVDTSVVFPHRKGPPFKRALKTLMAEFLQRIIQNSAGQSLLVTPTAVHKILKLVIHLTCRVITNTFNLYENTVLFNIVSLV